MDSPRSYHVSDGDWLLTFTEDDDGWYCITCPSMPGLVTQARTLAEGFEMARDARDLLMRGRQKRKELDPSNP